MSDTSDRRSLLRRLERDTASHVHGLLDETFGGFYDGFEAYMTGALPWHEWRFSGSLGFGGKLHLSGDKLYVGYYPEDQTPERDALVAKINRRLEELVGQ